MAATQRPATQEALVEPSGERPLWKELPSWFLFGEQDRIIPAALQHFMAERAGARRTSRSPAPRTPSPSPTPTRPPADPRGGAAARGRLTADRPTIDTKRSRCSWRRTFRAFVEWLDGGTPDDRRSARPSISFLFGPWLLLRPPSDRAGRVAITFVPDRRGSGCRGARRAHRVAYLLVRHLRGRHRGWPRPFPSVRPFSVASRLSPAGTPQNTQAKGST